MTWRPGRRKTLAACRSFGRNFPLETFVKMLFQFVHVPKTFGKLPDSDSTCNEPPRHKPVQSILKLRLDHKKSIRQLRLTVNFPLFTRKNSSKNLHHWGSGRDHHNGTISGPGTRDVSSELARWGSNPLGIDALPNLQAIPPGAAIRRLLIRWGPCCIIEFLGFLVQRSQKFYTTSNVGTEELKKNLPSTCRNQPMMFHVTFTSLLCILGARKKNGVLASSRAFSWVLHLKSADDILSISNPDFIHGRPNAHYQATIKCMLYEILQCVKMRYSTIYLAWWYVR